jgi:hypothetical protein
MSVVMQCAEKLNQGLVNLAQQGMPRNWGVGDVFGAAVGVVNAKSLIFNACTAALIACVVFGMVEAISAPATLVFGACFLFGRAVADASFNVMLPNFVNFVAPNIARPRPWTSVGEIVIFYEFLLPR